MSTNPDFISVRFETLQQAETELAAGHAAVRQAIEDLKAKLDVHLAEWTGEARTTYQQVQLNWDKSIAHMAEVLNSARIHIANAQETYTTVEQGSASHWRG